MEKALKLYTEGLEGADWGYSDSNPGTADDDAPSIDTAATQAYEVSSHMAYAASLLAGRAHVHVLLHDFKAALTDANMAIVSCPVQSEGYLQVRE